jgi:hypothetical protein
MGAVGVGTVNNGEGWTIMVALNMANLQSQYKRSYLQGANIRVRVIESIPRIPFCASIVLVYIKRQGLRGGVGTSQLHKVLDIVHHLSGTSRVLDRVRCDIIIIAQILLILQLLLHVGVDKSRDISNVCSHGFVAALFVSMFENRKHNNINVIAVDHVRNEGV